ncbi:MAG TPA: M14 family metallopeptidase [Candidatus Thermoplasmatota archaeon]|nr:M14 family metallopeptidase [Candidatus Thermoplasmatota archaeon]
MRTLAALAVLLLVPAAGAEFGPYGTDGWPLAADGSSTNPFPGLSAGELDPLLAQALAGEPLNRVGGAAVYPYWPLLSAEVQRMAADHPDRVRLHPAGKSTLGLDLWMLEVADFSDIEAGHGLPLERREVVWVDGGTHSNEYSGVYFALAWAQFLVEAYGEDADATWIVQNRHTWVLPMVNPDGSHAMGRLNANGVNINRNYPVVWDGQGHDALMNNRGPAPASEAETQVTMAWSNRTMPDYYASIHCCGNLWLYPYGEAGVDPLDQEMLQRVCDEAFADVRAACGPIWSTIYPASGSSIDTAYEHTGAVAFGYEMSGRDAVLLWGQPVTFSDVREQERESWAGLLHASLNVHRYGAYPVVTEVRTAGDRLVVTVRNDGLGVLDTAVVEMGDWFPLPTLQPSESARVAIQAPEASGDLNVHYRKRLMPAGAPATVTVPVVVGATAPEGGFAVAPPSLGAEAAVPSPGLGLLLLGLALLATRRRGA